MILFRIVYSIAIFAVYIIFRQSMDISMYMAFLYSGVTVLCILLLDLLLGGIKSYRIISSLLIGIAFLVLGFLLIQSFQSVFQQKEINLIVLFLFLYAVSDDYVVFLIYLLMISRFHHIFLSIYIWFFCTF